MTKRPPNPERVEPGYELDDGEVLVTLPRKDSDHTVYHTRWCPTVTGAKAPVPRDIDHATRRGLRECDHCRGETKPGEYPDEYLSTKLHRGTFEREGEDT